MADNLCKHYWVTGKVQGVWFRASTKKEADKLGVTGWVRNVAEGRVEVLACGTAQQLAQLESWLSKGPDLARVDELLIEDLAWREHQGFHIA